MFQHFSIFISVSAIYNPAFFINACTRPNSKVELAFSGTHDVLRFAINGETSMALRRLLLVPLWQVLFFTVCTKC